MSQLGREISAATAILTRVVLPYFEVGFYSLRSFSRNMAFSCNYRHVFLRNHVLGTLEIYINNYLFPLKMFTCFYMSDTQIHDGIKYFYIENIEKINLLEEKL